MTFWVFSFMTCPSVTLRHALVWIYRSKIFDKFILPHIFFIANVKVIFSPILSFDWLVFEYKITTDSCILIFYPYDFINSLIVCNNFLVDSHVFQGIQAYHFKKVYHLLSKFYISKFCYYVAYVVLNCFDS